MDRESHTRSTHAAGPAEERLSVGLNGVVAVGLTGSLGAGKSTALRMFADLGAAVFSTDKAVHELYRHADVRDALRGRLGAGVLGDDGSVDRTALRQVVLADEQGLKWLEEFVHVRVGEEMRRRLTGRPAGTVVVFEVPLLFDTGMERMFDLTVTIEAGRDVRAQRAAGPERLAVFEGFDRRQLTRETRMATADIAFVNDGDREHLRRFVETAYRRAVALAGVRVATDVAADADAEAATAAAADPDASAGPPGVSVGGASVCGEG